jgi:hypothetical protein
VTERERIEQHWNSVRTQRIARNLTAYKAHAHVAGVLGEWIAELGKDSSANVEAVASVATALGNVSRRLEGLTLAVMDEDREGLLQSETRTASTDVPTEAVVTLDPWTVWSFLANGTVRLRRRPRIARTSSHESRPRAASTPRLSSKSYLHRRTYARSAHGSNDDPSPRSPLERGSSLNLSRPQEVSIG